MDETQLRKLISDARTFTNPTPAVATPSVNLLSSFTSCSSTPKMDCVRTSVAFRRVSTYLGPMDCLDNQASFVSLTLSCFVSPNAQQALVQLKKQSIWRQNLVNIATPVSCICFAILYNYNLSEQLFTTRIERCTTFTFHYRASNSRVEPTGILLTLHLTLYFNVLLNSPPFFPKCDILVI